MTHKYNKETFNYPLRYLKCLLSFLLILLGQIIFFPTLSRSQIITTVAGSLKSACPVVPCGDGGLAVDAKLYSPAGMSVGKDGHIYIAEYSNHSVRKVDINTGIITTFAGTQRTACTTAPCGDGGLASSALLNGPRGVHVDNDGNIYIADFSNHAIRKIDKITGIITTVAGTLRSSCPTVPCGDGGLATNARLNSPTGVGFDSQNNMYVVDYGNHVIRKVDKLTGIITTVAGTMKSACSAAPCGDGSVATAVLFNGPSAIDFDADDNMFIAEYGNHSIRRIDKLTGIVTTYAGTQRASCSVSPCGDGGSATSTDARLTSPFSLRIGPDNNLYISDASNAAVRKVDRATNIITTVAGIPKSTCGTLPCGEGSLATSAQLANPFAIDFSLDGNTLYILEYSNQALRKVTPMGLSSLPVQMKSFSAVRAGEFVNLSWESQQEENLARYDIERSSDGVQFSRVGSVPASGGNTPFQYSWQDGNPTQAQKYYRIRAVDYDGEADYSKIVLVPFEKGSTSIRISPNPVTGNTLQVEFAANSAGDEIDLILYNAIGQPVLHKVISGRVGMITENLTLPAGLTKGVYTVFIGNKLGTFGRRRVILR